MIGKIVIKERGSTPKTMRKEMTGHLRAGWQDAGEMWHRDIRPKKFTARAFYEYGYTARSPRYIRAKRRAYGHNLPIVKTGETRRLTRVRDVRSTSKGTRVVLRAPKLTLGIRKGMRINLADEMRRVSRRDADQVAEAHDDTMDRRLNASKTQTQRTI